MPGFEIEGLRDEGDDTVESTSLGKLSATAQRNKARKLAYTKMLMKQMSLNHEDAEDLIDTKGLDYFILKFGSPRETDDMDEDLKSLKSSLLGAKKKRTSMIQGIEDAE